MPATNVPWSPSLIRLPTLMPGQMGVPGTDNVTGLRLDTNGLIFYVDPNAAGVSDERDGTDPTEPFATVTAALTHCRAYMNDTIVVAPNSLWTYGNTAVGRATSIEEEVIVSTPGVRIVGLSPSGALGVNWTFSAINQTAITVNALDVLIEGFNFWSDVAGCTGVYTDWDAPPYGENTTVRNCFFYALAYGIRLDYSWNGYIENNVFQGITTAAINSVDTHGDPDYTTIINNTFTDCEAAIDLEDSSYCTIHGNRIMGDPTGTNNYIDLTGGGANNLVSDNWLGCTIAQYDVTCSDATSGAWVNNHCIDGDAVANPV